MPGIVFTEEDIKAAADMPAGWYPLKVKSMTEGAGKNDPSSTTFTGVFQVLPNQNGFDGREVRSFFNMKMPKNVFRYLAAFGVKAEPNKRFPIEDTMGRDVQGYIIMDMKSGYPNITDWRPIEQGG